MEFKKVLISDKEELKYYKEAILELFEKTFSRKLSTDDWDWAYIKNPNGNPIVSLYFHENKLIGHYAIIPVKLKESGSLNSLLTGLSMTTMVDSQYRKYGVFIKQANEVFSKAELQGYSLVYGFPNKNSAPGFVKRLGWTLDKSYVILSFQKKSMPNKICTAHKERVIEFDFSDELQKEWRLNKPRLKYCFQKGLVTKPFDSGVDILYFDGDCSLLEQNTVYNILTAIDICTANLDVTPYIFGYKLLNKSVENSEFKVDLIMSDIF